MFKQTCQNWPIRGYTKSEHREQPFLECAHRHPFTSSRLSLFFCVLFITPQLTKQLSHDKQLLDKVCVISRKIKVKVRVISRSLRLRLTTLTKILIILDITKTESNNCFIIHWTKGIAMSSLERQYSFTMPLSTQMYKWEPVIGLITVFVAILTGRQSGQKLVFEWECNGK